MSVLDRFKKKDPAPTTGELVGKGEIIYEGKQEKTYFAWLERSTYTGELNGKKYPVGVYRVLATSKENRQTFKTFDQEIITDTKQVPLGVTAYGMKIKTRLMGGIMIVLDILVMYFLYLIASSGFVIQYNPQAMSMFIALVGFIVIAFAVLLIYLWYASKVTTFSVKLRLIDNATISAAMEDGEKGIPVYLTNSIRESPEKFFERITGDNITGALNGAATVMAKVNEETLKERDEHIREQDSKIRIKDGDLNRRVIESTNEAIGIRPFFYTTRSWLPVAISIIVVVAGFLVMYFMYG